jgi:RNA polymerase sigma-70 factor, ECF subfamily
MGYPIIQEQRGNLYESQLVLEAQKGDLRAFNELVLIYQDVVYNLAYRILGDEDSAEDITQDTFLSAYRNMPRFRNGSFRSWLFRITTNACFDELRRRKRHPILSIESEDGPEEDSLSFYDQSLHQISPEQSYLRREMAETLQQALNSLDPDQRSVVVMVDLQDMDYQEAARVLHIPIGTVKSRLARARVRLHRDLFHQDLDGYSLGRATDRIEESQSSSQD